MSAGDRTGPCDLGKLCRKDFDIGGFSGSGSKAGYSIDRFFYARHLDFSQRVSLRVSNFIRAVCCSDDSAYGGEAELSRYEIVDRGDSRRTSPTSIDLATLRRDDYIERIRSVTQKVDRKRTYIVRINGDVGAGERIGRFRRSQSIEMHPVDNNVVRLDKKRIRASPLWQAVATIIYHLAVGLLAVGSV
jgi:hypothetical protein